MDRALEGIKSEPLGPTSILEDECHLHVHAILGDLPLLDLRLLLLDPGALDVSQGLVSTLYPNANGVIEALGGCRPDLGDFCDCHVTEIWSASPKSFDDAVRIGIERANKTLGD